MKKRFIPIILLTPLMLASCDAISEIFKPKSSEQSSETSEGSSSTNSSSSVSDSSSSSSESSSSSSSSAPEEKVLKNFSLEAYKEEYYTGDTISTSIAVTVKLLFKDGTDLTVDSDSEYVTDIVVENFVSLADYACSATSPIKKAGNYKGDVTIYVTYEGKNLHKTYSNRTFTFKSIFDEDIDTCTALAATSNFSYVQDDVIGSHFSFNLTFTWENHGEEEYLYNEVKTGLDLYLYKGEDTTVNKVNDPIVGGQYHIVIRYQSVSATIDFEVQEITGYRHVNASDLVMNLHEYDDSNSPIVENPKILIVPVTLPADDSSYIQSWTTSKLNEMNDYFFGDSPLSFVNYYKTISYGKMNFSGMLTSVYTETSSDYTVEKINADTSYGVLKAMVLRAVDWVFATYPSVDWSEYDQDNNGTFDNIHIITNYNATTWAGPLWPHVSNFGLTGTHDAPSIDRHSLGAINHMSSSITQVHEQGHIFGLKDYYDYTDNSTSNRNYIGNADMQSHNVFDWNSYSKLSAGLMNPYVIDGTLDDVTLTIGDAATTPDCILVPADYSTWNGSSFDEYFLIELFSNKGINQQFWSSYCTNRANLGNGGIRLYHVDARLYHLWHSDPDAQAAGLDGTEITSLDKSTWGWYPNYVAIGPNNSYNYQSTGYGANNPPACSDMKLLTLIQRGGTDTFGQNVNTYLSQNDLFKTGDTFTFNAYKHFLSKTGQTVTSMDNGETFPWTIEFVQVGVDTATIRIHK